MTALLLLAALFAAGALYQIAGEALDRRRYPPPGRCIPLPSGPTLHVYSQGRENGPTVVFEAGIGGSCLSWATVQPLVAEFALAVSYDRAGLGWSSGAFSARTVETMVAELAGALQAADLRGPYILVGHSFGCILIQAFAHTYPGKTKALVMVDPVTQTGWAEAEAQQLRRLKMGAKLARRGAILARFGVVRAALALLQAGGRRIPRLVARASAGAGNRALERLIGEVQKLPGEAQRVVAAHWSRVRPFQALAAYLESLPACARFALSARAPATIPLVILSAANATQAELAERGSWVSAHAGGRHTQVEGTGHWLQFERPELVAAAIREVIVG